MSFPHLRYLFLPDAQRFLSPSVNQSPRLPNQSPPISSLLNCAQHNLAEPRLRLPRSSPPRSMNLLPPKPHTSLICRAQPQPRGALGNLLRPSPTAHLPDPPQPSINRRISKAPSRTPPRSCIAHHRLDSQLYDLFNQVGQVV